MSFLAAASSNITLLIKRTFFEFSLLLFWASFRAVFSLLLPATSLSFWDHFFSCCIRRRLANLSLSCVDSFSMYAISAISSLCSILETVLVGYLLYLNLIRLVHTWNASLYCNLECSGFIKFEIQHLMIYNTGTDTGGWGQAIWCSLKLLLCGQKGDTYGHLLHEINTVSPGSLTVI